MKIEILLFAKLREIFGKERISLQVSADAKAKDVLPILFEESDLCRQIQETVMFAVNQNYVDPDVLLKEGDELALIPPVSGG